MPVPNQYRSRLLGTTKRTGHRILGAAQQPVAADGPLRGPPVNRGATRLLALHQNQKQRQNMKTQDSESELIACIDAIDLEPIKAKLVDPREGSGWTLERAEHTERLYRRFLFLCHVYRHSDTIVPTTDVDEMWHQHILDTRKYADDCDRVFGHFIHHFPYLGMRGAADALALQEAFERTIHIYGEHFPDAEPYVVADLATCNSCGTSSCTACGSGGAPGKFQERPTVAQVIGLAHYT